MKKRSWTYEFLSVKSSNDVLPPYKRAMSRGFPVSSEGGAISTPKHVKSEVKLTKNGRNIYLALISWTVARFL